MAVSELLASSASRSATSAAPPPRARLDAIDLLRGIVMVIMVVDHTRDFAFASTLHFSPTDLTQTTPAIFFTRWITHFCAPIFVFLAGTGAHLQRLRGRTAPELSRFLLTRGIWLIVLEFTVVGFGIRFAWDTAYPGVAQVIWAIGCGMIILAALVYLPTWVVGTIGVATIVLHNTLDVFPTYGWRGPPSPYPTMWQGIWTVLHGGAFLPLPLGHPFPVIVVLYAVIPWAGVMAAGYAAGAVYALEPAARRRVLLWIGSAATAAFVVVRAINSYGDPSPWAPQHSAVFTVLSFLNTTKYPPSLDYLLMTLGPALLALAAFDQVRPIKLLTPLITFGRVPLFFYLLQWYVAHGITIVASLLAHKPVDYLVWRTLPPPTPGPDAGFSLSATYLLWLLAIVVLYPLCAWFAGVKRRHRDWSWLSYL